MIHNLYKTKLDFPIVLKNPFMKEELEEESENAIVPLELCYLF